MEEGHRSYKAWKTLYLRFGNFLRRVAIEKVRPDPNGEIRKEEGYIENENDSEKEDNDKRFEEQETSVAEMATDIGISNRNKILENKIETLEKEVLELRDFKDNIEKVDIDCEDIGSIEDVVDNSTEKEKVTKKRIEKKMRQKTKNRLKR